MKNLFNNKKILTFGFMSICVLGIIGVVFTRNVSGETSLKNIYTAEITDNKFMDPTNAENSYVYEEGDIKAEVFITEGLYDRKKMYEVYLATNPYSGEKELYYPPSIYYEKETFVSDFPLKNIWNDDNKLSINFEGTFEVHRGEMTKRYLELRLDGWLDTQAQTSPNRNLVVDSTEEKTIDGETVKVETISETVEFDLDDLYILTENEDSKETSLKLVLVEKNSNFNNLKETVLWDSTLNNDNFKITQERIPTVDIEIDYPKNGKGIYSTKMVEEFETNVTWESFYNNDSNFSFKVGDTPLAISEGTSMTVSDIFGTNTTDDLVMTYRLYNNKDKEYVSKDIILIENPSKQILDATTSHYEVIEPPVLSSISLSNNEIHYVGENLGDLSTYVNFSFRAGTLGNDYIKIYANGTEIYKSDGFVHVNSEVNISSLLKEKNIDVSDGVSLTYSVFYNDGVIFMDIPIETEKNIEQASNLNFIAYDVPSVSDISIIAEEYAEGNGINYYGQNLPENFTSKLNFTVDKGTVEDNLEFILYASGDEICKLEGTEVIGEHSIDLSSLINSDGYYIFSYTLTDGVVTYTKNLFNDNIYVFEEFVGPSLDITINEKDINYSGDVGNAFATNLSFTLNKGSFDNCFIKFFANNTEIFSSKGNSSNNINLSKILGEKNISEEVSLSYKIYYFDDEIATEEFIDSYVFKKNDSPIVNAVIHASDENRYFYGDDIPDEDKVSLEVKVTDSLYLENALLKIYMDNEVIETFTGSKILNNTIDLSAKVKSAGNHTFYYEITDGITNLVKKQIGVTHNFRTFNVATLKATFSDAINGNYYSDYVKAANQAKLTLDFEQNDNLNSTYEIYANGVLISNASNIDKTIELSKEINGSFLNGDIKFEYKISSEGFKKDLGTKTFIRNDEPSISNVSVVSAKPGYYFYGTENITDKLKTTLSYTITDNVQLNNDENNFELVVVNGTRYSDPKIIWDKGLNVLGSKTFNLSSIIKATNNYNFTYFLDDGIGDRVVVSNYYNNTYSFTSYNLPKVDSSSIYSLLPGGVNYTGHVSDSNISKFDIKIYPESYNTVTNYKVYIGKNSSDKNLLTSKNVSSDADLSTSIDLSKFKLNDDFLDGKYSFFYEINFAENSNPVTGELTDLRFTEFVKNNVPYITDLSLEGASDGNYYTKDVKKDVEGKESFRTKLKYTVNDENNFNKLKVSVYEDNNQNNVYDDGDVIVGELSTNLGSSSLGTKVYDFTNLGLYHNNQTKTLKYMIEDSIGDRIDDASTLIGTYTFISNTKPKVENVEIDHLFGNDATIYFGEVAVDHQASLKFNLNEDQGTVKAYFGDANTPTLISIPLKDNGLDFSSNISALNINMESGKFALTIVLDDGIADVQYFYLNSNNAAISSSLSSAGTHKDAASKGYKFPVIKNVKPVINTLQTALTIPAINNGIIYTKDVRNDRRAKLSIKVDDDVFVSTNLYTVAIDDIKNFNFKEGLVKNNTLANYDLASTDLDGNKYLYIILDDGIADVQYVNISGQNIDISDNSQKNSLNFVKNIAPAFISAPSISNITNNKIFYGDVNVPERISGLTFSASEVCDYTIVNENYFNATDYYKNSLGDTILDNGAGTYMVNSTVNYNLTEKNYDRFVVKKFPVMVVLDDDIADLVTRGTMSYDFVKNARPVLTGSIDYGTNKNGTKAYKSIFVGLDDTATITQNLNLELTEDDDNVKVDNYSYILNQLTNSSNPIEKKESVNKIAPTFDLAAHGKNNKFITGTNGLEVIYSDGIWDSSIANDNFIINNVTFSKAGLPSATANLTGQYKTDVSPDKSFIFDMSMNKDYAGDNCFEDVDFSITPNSANKEISLTEVRLEYTMNNTDYQSESGWTLLTDSDRRTSLFDISDFVNNSTVTKSWLNYTGNDNKPVKFRFKVVDELDQTIYVPVNESDNFYLAREFAPGSPSKFLMYLGDSTTPSSDYTLNVGETYRFDWTKPSDTNSSQGDDIVKYIFTTTIDGVAHTQEIIPQNLSNGLAGSLKWICEDEGETTFSISSIDKFGKISRLKTIEKSGLKNVAPNEVDRSTIESTFNTLNDLNYIKRYNSKNYETEYTLSWINAGDLDSLSSDDYVTQWKIEYSPNAIDWYDLSILMNSRKVAEGEKVSLNYTLPSTLPGLDDANQIFFRIIAIDNRGSESAPSESSNAYIYTSDNKEPVWKNLDSIEFNSPEGYAVSFEAEIMDDSEISSVTINNEEVDFEKTENGATFDFITYKNGTYKFAVTDIYNNYYTTSQTITGIDAVPPTVELVPEVSQYTNKAYNLVISCIDSMTGIKKVYIEHTDLNGKITNFESAGEFISGSTQVDYKYLVETPGLYKVRVVDKADNETIKSIEISNINLNTPEVEFSQPSDLQNQQSTISLNATIKGTNITSNLGAWSVLQTSTIKNYGEIKTTSVDGTDATIDVYENGILRVRFTDIFGNESPILEIAVNNILDGNIENEVEYLMLESDYKANYSGNAERVIVNGTPYVKWNNKETTSCQLYGHVKIKADFNGLQYAWIDSDRSNVSNSTYLSSYGDINKPDEILFKFSSGKQSLYIIDIFGHFTQVVLTINGYVAPPACEINYEILTKEISAEGVDVFFEITSGTFIDNGFYNVIIDGITKNLFEDFVWGTLVDGRFIEDDTYKGKSFKYTFKENGSLKVWGQSSLDNNSYESIIVNITTIDKSVPIVSIEDFEKVIPQADKLTLKAATNATFISLEELKEQLSGLGYGLTEEEFNSYKVSSDGKTAEITLTHNVSGIFFYAKNAAGTIGNSDNVVINNIYESKLEMDLWVFFEDGTSMSYEEYSSLDDKSSKGIITINAVSSNTTKDSNGNYILRKFKEEENPGCVIVDSPYAEGGNMVTASYTFTEAGTYTFKLRDIYTGYLEKTVVVGDISIEEGLPEIIISTENIKGDNVPYVVSVKIVAETYNDYTYFLDDEGNNTNKSFIEKIVTENGTYTFTVVDGFGRKVEKSITIKDIFELNDKPSIEVSYNQNFTNKDLLVTAIVSNGKFIDVPKGWNTLSEINGTPVKIQKLFTENEEVVLSAINFYEDNSSVINKKVNIVNIDKEAPKNPEIQVDITLDGLLIVDIVDNGDSGTSGTKQFTYEIYSDSSNYVQEGIVLVGESVKMNSSDRNYKDGEYIIKIISEDNAGNVSDASMSKFFNNDSLVKDFMSTYNTIITSSNVSDMKDFYSQLIAEARDNLNNYTNEVQKQFVSEKCDLLEEVLETGETEQLVIISKIEDWLKQLAKNPSDTSFVPALESAINSLSDEALKQQYQTQLNVLVNNNNIINSKKNASSAFNYVSNGYIINPLSGVVYFNNIAGHFDGDGKFVRGIDSNTYYYLENGTKINLDLTFETFIDTKGNKFVCRTGLVNGSKYYDENGNLVDTPIEGGFYDSLGNWHELLIVQEYIVTFVDYNGSVISTQKVKEGEKAIAPSNPSRDGYVFVKWDKDFSNITSDLTVMAVYELEESDDPIITPTPTITPTPDDPIITPTPKPGDIAVTGIKLDKTSITIDLNDSVFLTAIITPENATNKKVVWNSSNPNVADVVDGVIIPLSAGTTKITVTTSNNLTAICTIKVLSAGSTTDDDDNIIIPPSDDYPTIDDIVTPTPVPDYEYDEAPSYWIGYLGSTMIGLTNETEYSTGNLRGFYDNGLSTLLYNGSGNINIGNKKNAYVNLGFKGGNYALVMNCIDINSTYTINGFGLDTNTGNVTINGSGGLGYNSYLVIFSSYSKDLTVAKNGSNISCDYDYDLQGYKVYNPTAGTYTIQSISGTVAPTDFASRYGFVNDTYSNPITYKEVVKMAYNALNRDSGEELFSSIDKNSEIYREASILQKYGIINNIYPDINSAITGKDAYDIFYMVLSQTNPYNINYDVSDYRYKSSISLQDVNNMIANIVQYF